MMTQFPEPFQPASCAQCRSEQGLGFDFTMAFQPLIDTAHDRLFGYEALVRGVNGEGAAAILAQVNDQNRYLFDQSCRVKAVELAARLGLPQIEACYLSINFLPNAIYRPELCIRSTLEACRQFDLSPQRLMFEVTEGERVSDPQHLIQIFTEYHNRGFLTAIDDFGAGYSGLNLLARFQPQLIKIDMELVRHLDQNHASRAILRGVLLTATELGIRVLAEGIETRAERDALLEIGITLHQGFFYAKPAVEALPLYR